MTKKNPAAVALGKLGGGKHSAAQIAARRENGRRSAKACVCGHKKSSHRWQRDGSRAGCKECGCKEYRVRP